MKRLDALSVVLVFVMILPYFSSNFEVIVKNSEIVLNNTIAIITTSSQLIGINLGQVPLIERIRTPINIDQKSIVNPILPLVF